MLCLDKQWHGDNQKSLLAGLFQPPVTYKNITRDYAINADLHVHNNKLLCIIQIMRICEAIKIIIIKKS